MADLKPGDTVNNRYKVTRKLGAGAMGSVYLCEDVVENNIQVALKVLISDNLDDQDVWAKGEYEALTRLRHPNLARVYNFGKIGSTSDYFIVSEFIKGIDLFTATEYVNYEELNDIIVQTCRALEYIHSKGYVHFDIKPDNILVTRQKTLGLKEGSKVQYNEEEIPSETSSQPTKPNVKLIDFGLAERITGSFSFAIKGTLNYLAPEIINGKTPDHRADLYSLGVTLYQITNRQLPHQCLENDAILTSAAPMKRSDLFEFHMKKHPEYLRVMIMRLLEENPDKRFQTAREVIQYFSKHSGVQYSVETKETQKSYLYSTRMVGRKKEMHLLKSLCERIFHPERIDLAAAKGKSSEAEAKTGAAAPASRPEAAEDAAESLDLQAAEASTAPSGASGLPILAMVSGEIGVGKSRLLEEFQHYLRLNDIQLFAGNCYEGTGNAYQPFIEILRQMVFGLGLRSEICQRYRPELLRLLPEIADDGARIETELTDRADKEKVFFIDRIIQLLIEVASEKPYVLIINNLHWADEVSVDLMGALLDRIQEQSHKDSFLKVLVVVSLRIDEQYSEGLKQLLGRMKDSSRCQDILLRRLKRSQIVELLQSMLGFTKIPAQFLDRIEEKTGGNPLFIQETLKALQDEGILKHAGEGWQIKTTGYNRVEIPASLEELLLDRVQKLEPVKREILEVMSVLNRPISAKIFQRFKRFSAIPILVHLRDLEDTGLVSKVFEGGKLAFQIDQPKMREIIYANFADDQRRRYHGEVGEVFADIYEGREEEILEDLAYHYQRSDLTGKALALAVKAGDRLKAIYANDRALEFYLYIIEKLDLEPTSLELWVSTQEKIGELCTIMGKYDLAEHSYDSLLRLDNPQVLTPDSVSRYCRKKGKIFEIQGDYDTALRCYKDARNHLAGFQDPKLLDEKIRVFNCIGWVYVCMGKYEKAMAISVEGLRVIEGLPEKIEHAMIFNTLGSANFYKGNYHQAIEFHSRSLKIQENLENIPEITVCLNNLGRAFMANSDYGEAMEHFQRALKNSEEIGDPYGRAVSLHNFGCLYQRIGRLDQAEAYSANSLHLSRSYNMRFLTIQNYILYGMILREQRDYSRAESHLFRALTSFSKQGNRWGLCSVLLEIIAIHRLRGNFTEATAMIDEAFRYASELDIDILRARCALEKGRILRDSGEKDINRLLEILDEALVNASKLECPELTAEIQQEAGDLLIRIRRLDDARQRYRIAEETVREILDRLPPELREVYREKHKKKFILKDSVVLAREVPHAEAAVVPPAPGASADSTPQERAEPPGVRADSGLAPAARIPMPAPSVLDCMNELMQALKSTSGVEAFLQFMLKRLLEISRGRAAFVLARHGNALQVRASLFEGDRKGSLRGGYIVVKLIESVLQTRRPVAIPDLVRDARIGDLGNLVKGGFRSLIILPYQGETEDGILYLLDPVPKDGDLADDIAFYTFFVNLIPLALMYQEVPMVSATMAPAEARPSPN